MLSCFQGFSIRIGSRLGALPKVAVRGKGGHRPQLVSRGSLVGGWGDGFSNCRLVLGCKKSSSQYDWSEGNDGLEVIFW